MNNSILEHKRLIQQVSITAGCYKSGEAFIQGGVGGVEEKFGVYRHSLWIDGASLLAIPPFHLATQP